MQIDFAPWLSKTREAMGWSQRELAKKMGVSHSLVSAVERSDMSPSHQFCEALGEALGADIGQIKRFAGLTNVYGDPPEFNPITAKLDNLMAGLEDQAQEQILAVVEVMAERERARASPNRVIKAKAPTV